jgi:hypothetical protein
MPAGACLDMCVFVQNARYPKVVDSAVDTWFAAGRVVYVERLIERGFTVERLFALPFCFAMMCIRDEKLRMLHVDMLSLFDDRLHSVDVLFSPWLAQMDPASCARFGLTMERLLEDGLSKRHVKMLRMQMSTWSSLFGMNGDALKKLGITQYSDYFPEVAVDLGRGGVAAGMPSIEL